MNNADQHFATLQDFIVGRLSDDERQAFEDRLVLDPALVRDLEQSLRMREGLRQLKTQGYFKKAAVRSVRLRVWMPALAAASTAGLALFLWLSSAVGPAPILLASLESHGAADVTPLVAAHFTFVSVRGSSVSDLDLPSAGLIEIRAAPITNPTVHHYRVSLVRQKEGANAESVAALAGLSIGEDGYVHFYADASRLARGSYILGIQPDTSAPSTVELFFFNLRPPAIDPSK